jgi:predicted RNA-binding protein with PUA-like domain
VSKLAYPDATQFDPEGKYYDPKASRENPRWFNVDVKLVEKTRLVSIAEMRAVPALADMITLRRGNRLSITPVTSGEWAAILKLAARKAPAA